MLDDDYVDQLRAMLTDRFTAEEVVEILGLEVEDIFERFLDECLRTPWMEYL